MDIVDMIKNYTLCVYIFFTIYFWFFLLKFIHWKIKQERQIKTYHFIFLIITAITTPVIWPILSAKFLINYMNRG